MLEMISFPFFDQRIAMLNQSPVIDNNHHVVSQIANEIINMPNIQQVIMSPFDLIQQQQEFKNRQDLLLEVEREYEEALQIADNAIIQAEQEIEEFKQIEQEQENMRKQMLTVRDDFQSAHQKEVLFKQEQVDILENLELMQKTLREISCDADFSFPRLDQIFLEIGQIKFDDQNIDQKFKQLDEQSRMVKMDQTRLDIKIQELNESAPPLSKDVIDWIMNAKILQNPIVKEKLQEFFEHLIVQLSIDIPTHSSEKRFSQAWEKIKNTQSVTSYCWKNLTFIASKTVSWVAWAALETYQLKEKIVPILIQWTWSRNANTSIITWLAIAILTGYLVNALIMSYPIIVLPILGCLFLFK